MSLDGGRRKSNITGIVAAAVGLLLLAWYVQRTGPSEIWDGLRNVGWGFPLIVAVAGSRLALRAWAWSLCVDAPHELPFRAAFGAILAGDAVGNLTPLGLIASEPVKAAIARQHVPLGPTLATLAIENLLYTISVAAMIIVSTLALLYGFEVPQIIRTIAWVAVAAMASLFPIGAWMLWRRPAVLSRLLSLLLPGRSDQLRVDRLRELEDQVYTFAVRRRAVLLPLALAYVSFHALGVLEIHVTWWLIEGVGPPLLISFVLEGANRLVTVAFKFVPLRLGVDEWTTGSFTAMLGYGMTVGGTLAIVRKVRVLFWVAIGTTLLVRKGLNRKNKPRADS